MLRTICRLLCPLLISLPLAAEAQYGQKPPEPKAENLNTSGTVKGVRGGLLHVVGDGGDQWLVQVRARPQDISFTASAEPAFLKPGMLVQFTGKFNKRGQCVEPVAGVTIFTIREGYAVGIAKDEAGGIAGTKNFFSDAKEEKPAPKTDEIATYRVAGQLTKLSRDGEMTVNAGGAAVKANLAQNATVSVDVNNLAMLREGDKIELRGQYYPAQKGQAWATWVSVSAKEPLADPTKKKSLPAAGAKKEEQTPPADGKKPAEPAPAQVQP